MLEIELSGNNLQGEVPPEFSDLVNLESLTLSGNFLTSLPPEIGNLTNLEYLHLGYFPRIGPPHEFPDTRVRIQPRFNTFRDRQRPDVTAPRDRESHQLAAPGPIHE